MIQIQDKNVENQVYFPKSTNIEGDLVLKLHSELTQKDYTFDVVNESKTSNYYKFNVNFKSVENGEYTYFINDTDSGLIRIGNVDEAVSTSTYIDGIEVVQYYPQDVKETGYSKEPLTFKILSYGTINWTASNTGITKTIEYKVNGGKWASITSNTGETAPTINVVEGDKIQFRGNNAQYSTSFSLFNSFGGSALFEVEGNIMSLIYGDDFKNKLTINNYAFASLFKGCTKLVSAENLILPATTLANYCYSDMFNSCSSLTAAPELPATNLANKCYQQMFNGCTSLITAPELPATTLADRCYYRMFQGCTSLTTVPELPATTMATYCYGRMFQGCTSLTTVPSNLLPATTLAKNCYSNMFQGCTLLAQIPELPATTLTQYCYFNMFSDCTSLTTAPVLPATTLASSCYAGMFNSCTSLNYIKCLATDISATDCTFVWVTDVAETGTFVKKQGINWAEGISGIPNGWAIENNI